MRKLYSQIIGMPVSEEYTMTNIGLVRDILIYSENGSIAAFILSDGKIVVPTDVSRVTTAVFIADRECITDPDDVLRIKEILNKRIPIIGARTVNTRKEYIGKVLDFEIETKTMMLSHIITAKTFLFFHIDERIFARKQIVSITQKGIAVLDQPEEKVEEKSPAPSGAFA